MREQRREEAASPTRSPRPGRRWWRAWPILVIPLIVGLVASFVLAGLRSQQERIRDARLLLSNLHENVLVQETLVGHATVMRFLTPDVPKELSRLATDTENGLKALARSLDNDPLVARMHSQWHTYRAGRDDRIQKLGNVSAPSAPAHTGSDQGTGGHVAPPPAPPAAGSAASTDPRNNVIPTLGTDSRNAEFLSLISSIDDFDSTLAQRARDTDHRGDLGALVTVVLEAFILSVLFWHFFKVRRQSDLDKAEKRILHESEQRFRSLVQNSSDVVTVVEPDTRIRYQSPAVERILGYDADELAGTLLNELVHPRDRETILAFIDEASSGGGVGEPVEFRLRHRDGSWVHVESLASNIASDSVGGLVLTTRDVSERKAFEERLTHQAFHDSLTGLANRGLFGDRLSHALVRRRDNPAAVAVLFLDLDDFKTINDSLGHAPGDTVLREVAKRIQQCLRASDTAARFGGDEFAVLLEDVAGIEEAREVAERILDMFHQPITIEGMELFVQASIGIALGASGLPHASDLLRNADVAMYLAKSRGKANIQIYQREWDTSSHQRLELKAQLQHALERGELVLRYQPILDLRSGRVAGVEALLRWMHPTRGLTPPREFISLAEETGLILPIGRWVLEEACQQARSWHVLYPSHAPLMVGVNLAPKQLEDRCLTDDVAAALTASGLEPSCLVLEITEGVVLRETGDLLAHLTSLKKLGVRLAIDDFGTGYSSLSHLRRLPVDILKIDKCFIDNVSGTAQDSALASAIIKLGQILELQTIAEGIEQEDQARTLRGLECDLGQGYLFGEPLASERIDELLASQPSLVTVSPALDKPL
jgi:diguanylate cyclase (GGDEF)-like protein/PAS domain S-box-containing protein